MMRALRDHYSFTELKMVDWNQLEKQYSVAANSASGPNEFVTAIAPLLSSLRDMHVWIDHPDGTRVATHSTGFQANYDHAYVRSKLSALETFEGIGFVGRVGRIAVIAVSGLPTDGPYDELMESIAQMEDVEGVIFDLRHNSGGSEGRAAQIAGPFIQRRTKYARSLRRESGVLKESNVRYIDPDPAISIPVPIVGLIGSGCVSSGEGFALMLKAIDDATVIGQPTRGASGNPRPVVLSNGVRIWFSRWVSLELDGSPIESRGVLPDETVEHGPLGDNTFEKAIEMLQ